MAVALLTGWADPRDPYGLKPVVSAMMFDGVETEVVWRECGFVNAFYAPEARQVTLCTELRELGPGVIRFILAHELAHGVIIQRDLAFTGSSEWAADELAGLVLILMGYQQDVLDAADFWFARGTPETPTDPHLGADRRGWGLLCMVATKKFRVYDCDIDYGHVVKTWVKLLDLSNDK